MPLFIKENAKYFHLAAGNQQGELLRLAYEDPKTKGRVLVSPQREKAAQTSKNERIKLEKEMRMCQVFAKNGYTIELQPEVSRIPSPDVLINGIPADLKSVSSPNNIVKYAKKAIRKQGAEAVLFEINEETREIHLELTKLKDLENATIYYYFKKHGKVFKL